MSWNWKVFKFLLNAELNNARAQVAYNLNVMVDKSITLEQNAWQRIFATIVTIFVIIIL